VKKKMLLWIVESGWRGRMKRKWNGFARLLGWNLKRRAVELTLLNYRRSLIMAVEES
jgi:hypothetical protein